MNDICWQGEKRLGSCISITTKAYSKYQSIDIMLGFSNPLSFESESSTI